MQVKLNIYTKNHLSQLHILTEEVVAVISYEFKNVTANDA